MNNYIMVTPAKNEEKCLPDVIRSVDMSTLTPKLWVIVDDNSTDNTPDILRDGSKKHAYLEVLSMDEESSRDLTYHYSYVCKRGFDHAIKLAQERNIDWDYIVLLDADTTVEPIYFEGIIHKMNSSPKIGISSGDVHIKKDEQLILIDALKDVPSGTGRIWKSKCFYETGGYSITPSPDSISRVKAHLKGWETIRYSEYNAYQLRETSSAEGLWKGFVILGKSFYFLNKHPLLILINAISYTTKKPHYTSIAFLFGYLNSFIRNENQIDDEEIRDYYWNTRLKELFLTFRQRFI